MQGARASVQAATLLRARALQSLVCCAAGTLKCLSCKRTMPGRGDAARGPPLCADCAAEEGAAARVWLVGRPPTRALTPACACALLSHE